MQENQPETYNLAEELRAAKTRLSLLEAAFVQLSERVTGLETKPVAAPKPTPKPMPKPMPVPTKGQKDYLFGAYEWDVLAVENGKALLLAEIG
ncbi:MAG: hypothetical protein LBS96_08920, partial [Oscillospiraceae bacterium]|nr:hypothetical protein [Oscillospiraceae bacterium]